MNQFLILVIFLIFGASSVSALQDPQITFPISELGNCNNVQTCKVYCDQIENYQACKLFAKSKGLYKDKIDKKQVDLLSQAKTELGCETIISCREFCSQEVNYQKCQSFAQKHGLTTAPSANDEELFIRAQQNLNCDSFESCKTLCDQKENYVKCAALLQDQMTSDERAMFEKYKPLIKQHLGCDSLVTCMAFCINPLNTKKCEDFGKIIEAEQGGTYEGNESTDPEVWCPQVSPECSWDGTNCVCQGPETCAKSNDIPGCTWDGAQCNCPGIEGSEEEWCPKAGPGCAWDGKVCICPGVEGPTGSTPTEPGDVWCPKVGPYCVWDGSSCTCWDDCVKNGGTWTGSKCEFPQESKEVWCSKLGQYCVWDGNSCVCWDECVKAGGKWTGSKCEYQGGTDQTTVTPNTETPEASCIKNPDCKWTGETCLCSAVVVPKIEESPKPQVQGVNTNKGLLIQILDFISGLF
ncbi:MAG: hypothetical protein AAB414_03720 [Patescibacteria group bacterium]